MVYCFAYNCYTNSSSKKSTFAFPPDKPENSQLRSLWIAACNRFKEDIDNAKCPRLCQDHFSPDSFTKLPEIAKLSGYRLDLKEGAVPDANLFTWVNSEEGQSNHKKKGKKAPKELKTLG